MPATKQHSSSYYLPRLSELGLVFWVHSFTIVSSSLVAVFVPALLYSMGFSVETIIIVYLFKTLLSAILQYPAMLLGRRIGANRLMAIAQVFDVIYYGLLFLLASHPNLLWLFVVVWAVDRALYWTGFHTNFSFSRDQKKEGKEIGGINAIVLAISSIAPIIAGLIVDNYGTGSIYAAAIASSTVAAIPAFRLRGGYASSPQSRQKISWWTIRQDLFANACSGIVAISDTFIWPLMIFILVGSYTKLGVLMALATTVMILTTIYVGRNERLRGWRFLNIGVWFSAMVSALRVIVSTGLQAAGANILNGFARALYQTPYLGRYYRKSDQYPRLEYVNAMETANSLGVVAYLLVVLSACTLFGVNTGLLVAIGIVAPITFGMKLLK